MLSAEQISDLARSAYGVNIPLTPGDLLFIRAIEREARQQALEEAAQACEEDSESIIDRWDEGHAAAQRSCADASRALKEQS